MSIRLVIAEDHDQLRERLGQTLKDTGIDVVGEMTTATDAVRLSSLGQAGVMLLDIKTSIHDALDVLRSVKSANPGLALVVYSQYERRGIEERARALAAAVCLSQFATS
ncbi:MAG: response regulator [Rubripirellula sp.]